MGNIIGNILISYSPATLVVSHDYNDVMLVGGSHITCHSSISDLQGVSREVDQL